MQATESRPPLADFYVGDLVEVDDDLPAEDRLFRVTSVASDGVTITGVFYPDIQRTLLSTEMEEKVARVRCGNMFRYRIDIGSLEFQNIAEEVNFWVEVDKAHCIRNAGTGFWVWELHDAIAVLEDEDGPVDAVIMMCGEYGRAYSFVDRDVAKRLRAATLAELRKRASAQQ